MTDADRLQIFAFQLAGERGRVNAQLMQIKALLQDAREAQDIAPEVVNERITYALICIESLLKRNN